MPSATPAPAQPPTPESTATYCLPSGPRYGIGLPMIPDGAATDSHAVLPGPRPLLPTADRAPPPVLGLEPPAGPAAGLRHVHLAVRPSERIPAAVAVEVHPHLHRLRAARQDHEDVLVHA